ncbi:hypothetical protein F4811DRAFT_572350 [Daldinia bambusicola]|nr:hypothetical protein F4811DRAFT_572350 [Daldinia bambusicola]
MAGCFPKLSFLRSKKSAQKQAANVADTLGPRPVSADTIMSKPEKYKTPSEKGTAVPGTASNSNWKPYTIPYTGAGAQRSNSQSSWVSQSPGMHESFAGRCHAAPPLYITGDSKKKKDTAVDKKGKQPSGNTEKKDKKATDQPQMFKGVYIVSRIKPEDRTPIE